MLSPGPRLRLVICLFHRHTFRPIRRPASPSPARPRLHHTRLPPSLSCFPPQSPLFSILPPSDTGSPSAHKASAPLGPLFSLCAVPRDGLGGPVRLAILTNAPAGHLQPPSLKPVGRAVPGAPPPGGPGAAHPDMPFLTPDLPPPRGSSLPSVPSIRPIALPGSGVPPCPPSPPPASGSCPLSVWNRRPPQPLWFSPELWQKHPYPSSSPGPAPPTSSPPDSSGQGKRGRRGAWGLGGFSI